MTTTTFLPDQLTGSWNSLSSSQTGNTGQQMSSRTGVFSPVSGNVLTQLLPLVTALLQQMPQQQQESTANAQINLSDGETHILQGTHIADSKGNIPTGQTLSVLDGTNADQRLSAGDTLVISNAAGNELSRKTLTTNDLYDLRFRENMVKTANSLREGWAFNENLVHIQGGELTRPETRTYTASNGSASTETVLERNNYWEVVQRGSNRYLLMRETGPTGQPVKPSEAINDVFNNRQNYAFDCASPMRLLNLKATLDTIGADDFDNKAGRLQISSWYDQHDSSGFDGGFSTKVRTAQAGEINVDGVSNLKGETALFDPNKGDALIPGSAYYFDLPGDNKSSSQGWNAVYLGRNDNGSYRFWSSSIGNVDVSFGENNWFAQDSFKGYYLGAVNANPNVARLQNWDVSRSV
ncbi:hypothetical protein SAMN05660964_02645 [Thiothrix caldifontis]|uniref:Uncharacterized protein n=1 Tax=Thiothrix caldifontis TaxID=525918 RepID=A0A1H4EMF3_9GAMM|nr:hypothetical protein [Thiothrix caldifontis]SEA86029.1 hypothetical protein SAMN05660964_02645 [Thiothrix caldifontis]